MKAWEGSLRRAALAAECHVAKGKYPMPVSLAAGLASSLSSGMSDRELRFRNRKTKKTFGTVNLPR